MIIAVLVKYVPDATGPRSFHDTRTVDRATVDGLLSELDEYAVEQALRLKESGSLAEAEVVAVTMGPPQAESAVRRALQMGADRAIHICDERLAGSDAMKTSLVLASAVSKLPGADDAVIAIVTGIASTDAGVGVVPAMLSERLGLGLIGMAAALESDEQEVRVRRDSDHSIDTLKSAWPCIISVTDQTGEPRYPSFKGIAAAKKKPVDVWSLDDLGLDGAVADQDSSYTVVDGIEERPGRGKGQVVRDESGSGAAALLDYFLQHNLLGGKSNV